MLQADKGHASALVIGRRWRHNGTDNYYVLVGKAKMKHPVTREWVDSVLYMTWPKRAPGGDIYVREESDFRLRFTEVHPTIHSS